MQGNGVFALALTTILALAGCGSTDEMGRPERATETPGGSQGTVVFSTGSAQPCIRAHTEVAIAPAGSPYKERLLREIVVDDYSVDSDFPDHHGNLSVLKLP